MQKYRVSGMSCAACSAGVEKVVSALEGVERCSVNLLEGSMGVEGNVDPKTVIAAVVSAGYGAELYRALPSAKKEEAKQLWICFLTSLLLLLPLMYLSMGHTMWHFPLPIFWEEHPLLIAILQALLAGAISVINRRFFVSGWKGVLHHAPNMDTLVSLGVVASLGYSLYQLVLIALENQPMERLHGLYFESAGMIFTLITLGKFLEAKAKGRTKDALNSLIQLAPAFARVEKDGKEMTLPVSELQVGDLFWIRPGERIPADGIVVEGKSAVDESALTGESIPVDKTEGEKVCAATLNTTGVLKCRAEKVGEETALAGIIRMVSDAGATKAPIAKAADKISAVFVPAVLCIATVTFLIWMLAGKELGFSLTRAISVLVVSCPCALGLATPVAIMVGNGVGAKQGILFKNAAAQEETGRIKTVVLDKTGTLTTGIPTVTDVIAANGAKRTELLSLAGSLEKNSEHPLAKAVWTECEKNGVPLESPNSFETLTGSGVKAILGGELCLGGKQELVFPAGALPQEVQTQAETLVSQGKTALYFSKGGKYLGMIAVWDPPKSDAKEAIARLHSMGVEVLLLSGDHQKTAEAIGKEVGISKVIAGVLPAGKEEVIRRLQKGRRVMMVGDGMNDAPALTAADVGVAIGTGTDVAVDAADVVLIESGLQKVVQSIVLGRATLRTIHENLFWAFFYNVIGIPLAAGAWIPINGWTFSPMFGAAAMSLSGFCVVMNALRLNFVFSKKKQPKRKKKDMKNMELILKVEGMMCEHCEKRVKKALEALPGVASATPDHVAGTVKVILNEKVETAVLKETIEREGYEVKSEETLS